MKKSQKTQKTNYTHIEKNIYRNEHGTYRVRVSGESWNAKTLREARKYKSILRLNSKSKSVI